MSNENTEQKTAVKQISRRLFTRMLITIALYTGMGIAIFALGAFFYQQFVWEGEAFIPRAVRWLSMRRDLLVILFFAGGYCAIFLLFWKKSFGYMHEVLRGAESIFVDTDDMLELSAPLKSIENQLNQMKITTQRNEYAARNAEKRKNDLVMYLAHDIKTPLASITGYLSLLCEAPDMPEAQRAKFSEIALSKALRLDMLVDEFFDITRFNLQSIVLEKKPVDLRLMLEQMADELSPLLAVRQQCLAVKTTGNMTITVDPDKLARVLDNIIRNATAYGEAGTEISITARKMGSMMHIMISNHGITIPKEKLTLMFDQFYRLDSSRSSETGGAGLGLAIAREIVDAHNGTITADSADGITSFSISLPDS